MRAYLGCTHAGTCVNACFHCMYADSIQYAERSCMNTCRFAHDQCRFLVFANKKMLVVAGACAHVSAYGLLGGCAHALVSVNNWAVVWDSIEFEKSTSTVQILNPQTVNAKVVHNRVVLHSFICVHVYAFDIKSMVHCGSASGRRRCFWASLLLHTNCNSSWRNWSTSCVVA